MEKTKRTWLWFLSGFLSLLVSIWSLMWIFSSSSLASGFCRNQFDLFHDDFRCRQPYIALILFVCFGIGSLVFFIVGIWKYRKDGARS